ncbi:hypothetical protein FHETE_8524 [Fusarium heterosporum]|uniref:Uncharacterized protein n=1 Tax=Fusarium heterosporum TaxID=42747 RepID=A0A8H5T2B3_FUSHE|nr:hypothetical protein FHETE_8524 [Fusarium heterosporum]
MASEPTPPLPVAASHAQVSNGHSLMLASRSSLFSNLGASRPAGFRSRVIPQDNDNDDDFAIDNTRPNDGIGYVPKGKDVQKFGSAKEERMLRGRMVRSTTSKTKKKVDESESDEDAGRSALGKRKRPRKERETGPDPEPEIQPIHATENEEKGEDGDGIGKDIVMTDNATKEATNLGEETTEKKRKRKSKNKKKQKNEKSETSAPETCTP